MYPLMCATSYLEVLVRVVKGWRPDEAHPHATHIKHRHKSTDRTEVSRSATDRTSHVLVTTHNTNTPRTLYRHDNGILDEWKNAEWSDLYWN